jgi:hypothetical protein
VGGDLQRSWEGVPIAWRKKTPELTPDRTVRLLREAIAIPGLSLGMAIRLVAYHIRRNQIARKSHTKTWMAKHPKANYLLLQNYSRASFQPVVAQLTVVISGGA